MTNTSYGLAALWTQGDLATRAVALLLLAMSIASWYVIATRGWQLFKLQRAARAMGSFWHAKSFAEGMSALDVGAGFNPFRHIALEGQAAVKHHADNQEDLHGQLTLADWMTESLRGAIDESAERMGSGLAILASVGSIAPFIGLFGTVWGIYHALVGISASGMASIDKVAGPVGEALIMTAFGLAVAIPAVLGYNTLTRGNKGVIGKLHRFARQLHAYFLTGAPVSRPDAKPRHLREVI
ncbi:MotA/TolQ/ExbB proton channel family protein [Noviherbaspirillum pedocola]|uniref:Biopolymer transport protein ExbB n=1 Tax=Noviherbaspirillum pedocola TaxID=2801341 RepID=A0A934SUR2_9BURK|nr:MotA/TolQ/ExbB proton channel family protein [Noviherbaspirillum pedocola]MBK4737161.1 MotA/TolQ/ExbB proton channel family protein [Noviherbaspirillum pedocola]